MNGLDDALASLASTLEQRGIPYMVIGGFANLIWGEPRTTLDLDVTVATEDVLLIEAARAAGQIMVNDPVAFLERARVLPVRLPDGTRVDLIAATLPYEMDAVSRARSTTVAGRSVRVCTPEDLIIHKIVSERPKDQQDVVGVFRRQGARLDLAFLDPIVEGLARDLGKPEIWERYLGAREAAGL